VIKGIGVDIVDMERFHPLQFDEGFLLQVFTSDEIARIPQYVGRQAHLAKIFALKEATMKALGCGLSYGTYWKNIEVDEFSSINVSGFLETLFVEKALNKIHNSFTHSNNYVTAVVILEG
jgi:holo-[acyl-carrier protein] synthase